MLDSKHSVMVDSKHSSGTAKSAESKGLDSKLRSKFLNPESKSLADSVRLDCESLNLDSKYSLDSKFPLDSLLGLPVTLSRAEHPLKASSGVWGVKGGIRGATFARVALPLGPTCTFKPPCPPLKKTQDSKKLGNVRRKKDFKKLDSKG